MMRETFLDAIGGTMPKRSLLKRSVRSSPDSRYLLI